MGEENLLLEPTTRTYKARWWIMCISSLHFIHQNFGLNTWGPIAQSAKAAYDWEDTTIAFILNMGRAGSILCLFVGCYLLDRMGLRVSMNIYSVIMLLSNGLRSLSKSKELAFWLITIGEFLNGSTGVITFAAPPIIAATWFPPGERITAVAIMVLAGYVGDGISSIIGPVMVARPRFKNYTYNLSHTDNLTSLNIQEKGEIMTGVTCGAGDTHSSGTPDFTFGVCEVLNSNQILDDLMNFLYMQCVISVVLLVATLAYYPDKPVSAPSTSAAMPRLNYRESIKELVRNKRLVTLILVFGIMVGVYMSWVCVIDIVYDPLGVSQMSAGWIGFYTILAGSILGFVIARFSDIFMRRIKPVVLTIFTVVIGMSLWTALLVSSILPFSTWQLYVSAITGGALLNASFPLWYELVCEMSFPLPGGIVNGISDFVFLVFANIFYALMYIPAPDYRWLTWTVFVCSVLGFVTLAFFPVTYIRTDIDMKVTSDTGNQDNELSQINMDPIHSSDNDCVLKSDE